MVTRGGLPNHQLRLALILSVRSLLADFTGRRPKTSSDHTLNVMVKLCLFRSSVIVTQAILEALVS